MSLYEKLTSIDNLTIIKLKINNHEYKIHKEFVKDSEYLLKFFDNSFKQENEIKILNYCNEEVNKEIIDDIFTYLYQGEVKKIPIQNYKIKDVITKNDTEFTKNNIKTWITYLSISDYMMIDDLIKIIEEFIFQYFFKKIYEYSHGQTDYYGINEIEYLNTYFTKSNIINNYYLIDVNDLIYYCNLEEEDLINMLLNNKYKKSIFTICKKLDRINSKNIEKIEQEIWNIVLEKLKSLEKEN